jgi:hypothetical protein
MELNGENGKGGNKRGGTAGNREIRERMEGTGRASWRENKRSRTYGGNRQN